MTDTSDAFDAVSFLDFARAQMGGPDQPGSLAKAFIEATQTPADGAPGYPNFWQVGCVFDTILDYFLTLKLAGRMTAADQALLDTLLERAVVGYQYGIVGKLAAWYDDWCWWGIAAAKAFDPAYRPLFGSRLGFFQTAMFNLWGLVDRGDFSTIANSIPDSVWQQNPSFGKAQLIARGELHHGTRNTWAEISKGKDGRGTTRQNADWTKYTTQADCQWAVPRVPGGCWQYDFSSLSFPPDDGAPVHPDPYVSGLGTAQVTLMPGLYLVFCCGMVQAMEHVAAGEVDGGAGVSAADLSGYRQSADEVAAFLLAWLRNGLAEPQGPGILVHERTPTFARWDDGTLLQVPFYCKDAYWGGDQGLIMGALKQYARLAGVSDASIYDSFAAALLSGVVHCMKSTSLDGAVAPYLDPSGDSPISNDPDDYGSGSGVFWRYVMRCCRLDPQFGPKARQDPAVVRAAQISGMNPNDWGNPLFQPFNSVAAAIGAWHLLR